MEVVEEFLVPELPFNTEDARFDDFKQARLARAAQAKKDADNNVAKIKRHWKYGRHISMSFFLENGPPRRGASCQLRGRPTGHKSGERRGRRGS